MSTKKGSSIWLYFANTEDPEKVRCKICKKSLKCKRLFNLKQHLSHNHNIQIRLSRIRGLQHNDSERIKPGWNDETTKTPTTRIFENTLSSNPAVIIKNEVLLDAENLVEITNKNATANETETRVQSNVHDEEININTKAIISTHDDAPTLILPAEVSTNDEEMSKSNENGWVMLEESTISPNIIDFEPFPKTKNRLSIPKGTITENLDDPTFRLKEDSFEQIFKKRKLTLELECLEMHNYKIKLEIWEIEQKLQLQSSKFTKNITARRKKTENNE